MKLWAVLTVLGLGLLNAPSSLGQEATVVSTAVPAATQPSVRAGKAPASAPSAPAEADQRRVGPGGPQRQQASDCRGLSEFTHKRACCVRCNRPDVICPGCSDGFYIDVYNSGEGKCIRTEYDGTGSPLDRAVPSKYCPLSTAAIIAILLGFLLLVAIIAIVIIILLAKQGKLPASVLRTVERQIAPSQSAQVMPQGEPTSQDLPQQGQPTPQAMPQGQRTSQQAMSQGRPNPKAMP